MTSHCLHVPLSRKRQCSVYRSPLNLVWHNKNVCVSAYTWRHKSEATFGWITSTGIISIQRMMALMQSMIVACRLYDQQITMGQGIFCGLPELHLSFSECQTAIQIVRHTLFKRDFMVDFRWNQFKRYTGCVSYVFIIQSMQWRSSEMCFGMNIRRLNKTGEKCGLLGDSVSHASFI